MAAPAPTRRLRSVLAGLQRRTGDGTAGAMRDAAADGEAKSPAQPPNVLLVFGDQWRAHAFGYAGDANVRTPHIDALEARSVNLQTAVSGCPVCCPMRASLLTGQVPATHGVFVNDVYLRDDGKSLAHLYAQQGFSTGYIGKVCVCVCVCPFAARPRWLKNLNRSPHRTMAVACRRTRPEQLHPTRAQAGLPVLEGTGVHPQLQPVVLLRRRFRYAAHVGWLRCPGADGRRGSVPPAPRAAAAAARCA